MVIVRILGEGQFGLAEPDLDSLNRLDDELEQAVAADDEPTYQRVLTDLIAQVKERGRRLDDTTLAASAVVLPAADSGLDDVRRLLGDQGLIPG